MQKSNLIKKPKRLTKLPTQGKLKSNLRTIGENIYATSGGSVINLSKKATIHTQQEKTVYAPVDYKAIQATLNEGTAERIYPSGNAQNNELSNRINTNTFMVKTITSDIGTSVKVWTRDSTTSTLQPTSSGDSVYIQAGPTG